jgi:hypothetical protein
MRQEVFSAKQGPPRRLSVEVMTDDNREVRVFERRRSRKQVEGGRAQY